MNKLTKTLATLGLVGTLAGCASNQTKPVAQAQQPALEEQVMPAPLTESVYTSSGKEFVGNITTFGDGCKDVAYNFDMLEIKTLITHFEKDGRRYQMSAINNNGDVQTINLRTKERNAYNKNGQSIPTFLDGKAESGMVMFNFASTVEMMSTLRKMNGVYSYSSSRK